MIILHSALLDTGLFLWAEAPVGAEPAACESGSAWRAGAKVPDYPFSADFDTLARTIRNLPVGFRPTRRRLQTAAAWLPTQGRLPHSSSELIGEAPSGRGKVRMAPWRVEGLLLGPSEYFRVLTVYGERARALHGLLSGRDFSFWIQALRFAGSLVARQRFLPDIEQRASQWHAHWRPVWLGDDADERERLARRMPAAARALTPDAAPEAPRVPASERLETFVSAVVDQIVRHQDGLPDATSCSDEKQGKGSRSRDGNVYDRWLRALRSADSRVVGLAKDLETLGQQIRQWHEPIDQAARAPFRLCFRLEEPSAENGNGQRRNGRARSDSVRPGQRRWYVRYLLQGTEDPNLLVTTADAWMNRGHKAAALSRMGADLHETLLAFLGQAAGVCPRIEETLRSAKPSGYSLDARGAYEFLTVTAPALQQVGFGTTLPDWWTSSGTEQRLSVRARVHTPPLSEASSPSLDEALDFEWEICVGGRNLSKRDLDELARLKEPLQSVRGHWVEAGVEEIHAALEFWNNRKAGSVTARELVRLALGSADTSAGIRFDGVVATGWMEVLLTWLQDKEQFGHIEAPEHFVGELRPYQKRGYDWLDFLRAWGFGACLADDMGLGKTIQTLALLQRERECGEDRPSLIVCPTSVLANWEHEAARFTPGLTSYVHHGPSRPRGWELTQQAHDHNIVLTSYALLQRDLEDLSMVQWAGLILDEAQNVKNPATKVSRAVRALVADYRIALTGTPVENHVGDLWSIMDFLNPGFLGSEQEFKRSFFLPIQAHRDREASERLRKMTAPFILRRLKTDRSIISDLPEKLEMKVFCTLTSEQGRLYEEIVGEAEKRIQNAEGIERRGVILATLSKLKQVCNHPAHFLGDGSELKGRSGKLTRLTEMIEEILASGERTVLFTQFAVMGTLLREHLQDQLGREVFFLHGGTPKRRRDAMVARFQSEEDAPPIFVLSLKAGGTGLNLTAANHVFHFDRWWNPAVENQATDRTFRIGQKRRVLVHKFVCAGTLEERIDAMIERKRSIADDIVGSGENWITELSDDEIHHMLALEKRAVRD
jgi:SNF2 family DNA or RNA helicase